jgi:hypothetical protein
MPTSSNVTVGGEHGGAFTSTALHVFCDESYTSNTGQDGFRVQGALWVPVPSLVPIRAEIYDLRSRCHPYAEVKWNKLRGPKVPELVGSLVDLFFTSSVAATLRFECVVVQHSDDPTVGGEPISRDVGYYKTFHLLLSHRLEPGTTNHVFLDRRPSRQIAPERVLMRCLAGSGRGATPPFRIASCEIVESDEDDLIQLTDVLCGAVGWAWNGRQGRSGSKRVVHDAICRHLGWPNLRRTTALGPRRFGVWRYRSRGQAA